MFDGSFSWADYRLPQKGFSAIKNITVSSGDKTFINENTGADDTFTVEGSDRAIRIKWFYHAKDERRTFTIAYTLSDAIVVGPNWSEFFWNYVASNREKATDELDISIHLPQSVTGDSLYAWTRGPSDRIVLDKSAGSYSVTATDINKDESVKVRTVFPTYVFNIDLVPVTNPDFSLTWARNDEQKYRKTRAQQKKRQAYFASVDRRMNIFLLILSIAFFIYFYQKFGKRYSTRNLSDTETILIPDQNRPASIGWLLSRRRIFSNHLMATVLDLARMGYLKIEERPPEKGFLKGNAPTFSVERTEQALKDNLYDWEQAVIHFVEQQLADDIHMLHKIFKGRSSKVKSWYKQWQKSMKTYCFNRGWIDPESYKGAYWNAGVQSLIGIIELAIAIYTGPVAPLSFIFTLSVTIMAGVFSLAIIRRTKQGEEVYHQWKNYKKGLQNAGDYALSPDLLDRHFINAIALGLREKHLKNLFESSESPVPVFSWIVLTGGHSKPAAIASTFSALSATGASSFAGAAGGAGAAAGAAGGGAAGGAG